MERCGCDCEERYVKKPVEYRCDCDDEEECDCPIIGFDAEPENEPYCCGRPMKRV